MTKKQKTIKAMIETAEKYENPKGHRFFDTEFCPLCKIHYEFYRETHGLCLGCPLAAPDGRPGCSDFKSYRAAAGSIQGNSGFRYTSDTPLIYFLRRAAILREFVKKIEGWSEERFTRDGWTYSGKELSRDD